MNEKEAIKRLAKVFTNQQIILKKLAQMPASPSNKAPPEVPSESSPESLLMANELDEQQKTEDLKSDLREAIIALKGEGMSEEELAHLLKEYAL